MMNKLIIGLTGGIGAGKSVVARICRLRGIPVYDCDSEAKRLMEFSESLRDALVQILGHETYTKNGNLNKSYISSRLFSDSELREKVNKCVHSAVRSDFDHWASLRPEAIVMCEAAVFSSSRLTDSVDYIFLVEASEEERIKRVEKRNGLSREEIIKRMASQAQEFLMLPQDRTFVIDNTGDISLLAQIDNILKKIQKQKEIC